ALSLLLTAGALGLLWTASDLWGAAAVLLFMGTVGGPVNAASGRLVLLWFPADQRGLAMGIRQSALPLRVGVSALVLPAAADAWGFVGAMTLPALLSLLALPFVLVMPETPSASVRSSGREKKAEPEPARTGSPYRHWTIWRVHGVSMLLGVPQVALMTYAVIYLVQEQGWGAPAAGVVVARSEERRAGSGGGGGRG